MEPDDEPAAAVRGPELVVAALLMVFAGLVITDSLRVGMGWADDGPKAGYFPFYIGLLLLFGVMGYLFKKLKYPLAPLVLALVLGDMAEASFRQSMLLSQGSFGIFYANPLVAGITSLALLLLVWPLIGKGRTALRRRPE